MPLCSSDFGLPLFGFELTFAKTAASCLQALRFYQRKKGVGNLVELGVSLDVLS